MKNEHKKVGWSPNEHGFLMLLVAFAGGGLLYLFSGFIMPMIFAVILACATRPIYKKIQSRFNFSENKSAGITTFIVFLVIIAPISYLLTIIGVNAKDLYDTYPEVINKLDFSSLDQVTPYLTSYTPLSEENITYISSQVVENSQLLKDKLKDLLLYTSKSILNSSMGMLAFFSISLFSLFFFYRDGEAISERIKVISPLHDYYDNLLLKEISSLSGILTFSVLSIAVMQGLSFAIMSSFMGLDWVFIGVAIAVSSFIPVVGSALVWIPLSIYLYGTGHPLQAGIVVFWGIAIAGFVIDNLMRPYVMSKICVFFNQQKVDDEFAPLEHTFLVILSTLGGITTFGVLGLFLGPIIAAFSISVFGVYVLRVKNLPK